MADYWQIPSGERRAGRASRTAPLAREIKRLSEFVLGSLANFSLLARICSCVREPLANSLYNNVLIHHFPRLFRLINQLFGILRFKIKFNRRRAIKNKRTHRSDL